MHVNKQLGYTESCLRPQINYESIRVVKFQGPKWNHQNEPPYFIMTLIFTIRGINNILKNKYMYPRTFIMVISSSLKFTRPRYYAPWDADITEKK